MIKELVSLLQQTTVKLEENERTEELWYMKVIVCTDHYYKHMEQLLNRLLGQELPGRIKTFRMASLLQSVKKY